MMTQNKKNVMILIVLAALALVCGALLYLDPTGMRSCTTGQLEREFASRARQFLGDQGKITILQESNDDVIVFFCCNASRTTPRRIIPAPGRRYPREGVGWEASRRL